MQAYRSLKDATWPESSSPHHLNGTSLLKQPQSPWCFCGYHVRPGQLVDLFSSRHACALLITVHCPYHRRSCRPLVAGCRDWPVCWKALLPGIPTSSPAPKSQVPAGVAVHPLCLTSIQGCSRTGMLRGPAVQAAVAAGTPEPQRAGSSNRERMPLSKLSCGGSMCGRCTSTLSRDIPSSIAQVQAPTC